MANQVITVENITAQPEANLLSFDVIYSVTPKTDDTETSFGLDLNLYYDSSLLIVNEVRDILSDIFVIPSINNDSSDLDEDPNTDQLINSGWVNINSNWPGVGETPAKLYTVEFTTTDQFNSPTTINFTGDSPGGFEGVEAAAVEIAPPTTTSDSGVEILWRNTATGENALWFMEGATRTEATQLDPTSNLDWNMVGKGDFNNDGQDDILWRNGSNGKNAVWFMEGGNRIGGAQLPPTSNQDWNIVGTGDFNNDGQDDILWRNGASGKNAVWFMEGTTRTGVAQLQATSNLDWNIVGTGDFNNDGQDDILWRNGASGKNAVWFMDEANRIGIAQLDATSNLDWNIVGTGDFNNDGQDDILWRNGASGQNAVWFMDGTSKIGAAQLDTNSNLDWQSIV